MQKNLFLGKYLWKEKVCLGTVEDAPILDCAGPKMSTEER
jgi:hypothetical protein